MTRRILIIVALVVVVGGGLVWNGRRGSSSSASASAPAAAVSTVQVRRTDLTATELVNGTLGWSPAPPVVIRRTGTWTSLPRPGTTITPGQPVGSADGRAIVLLAGDTPVWRPIGPDATDGPDVAEVEANLSQLGFDPNGRMTVDGHFTDTTANAIRRMQGSLGEDETGVIDDGDVVFAPGPVRVGGLHADLGTPVRTGDIPFDATSTTRVVTVAIDPSRQRDITTGQAVAVDFLDGTTTQGTVASVAPTTSASGTPSATVTVTLADQNAGGAADGAPVQVRITTAARQGVLVVPITALLALSEGGYGVEVVDPDGTHHITAVRPGLFADSLVEITGTGIVEGETVVTAR